MPKPQNVHEIRQRQCYATNEDDQAALHTRDLIGEKTLMWGSDYPHTDSTWPCSGDVLNVMFELFPNEARQNISYNNVKSLYGL